MYNIICNNLNQLEFTLNGLYQSETQWIKENEIHFHYTKGIQSNGIHLAESIWMKQSEINLENRNQFDWFNWNKFQFQSQFSKSICLYSSEFNFPEGYSICSIKEKWCPQSVSQFESHGPIRRDYFYEI